MLCNKLISRGDRLEISKGKLQIYPASGKPVCIHWLKENYQQLVEEIAAVTGNEFYQYMDYATGFNPGHSYDRLTLNFVEVNSGLDVKLFFNVNARRLRDTPNHRKGERLPAGRFSAGARSMFVKFWKRSGLPKPRKSSEYPGKMHLLKSVLFNGEPITCNQGHKFKDKLLQPVNITQKDIELALSNPANSALNGCQKPANTLSTGWQLPAKNVCQGIPAKSGAARAYEDAKYVGSEVRIENRALGVANNELSNHITQQSTEEWLRDAGDINEDTGF